MVTSLPANQDAAGGERLGSEDLDALFIEVLERDPSKTWVISEVLEELGIGYSLLVSQRWVVLRQEGRVERVAPARYRAVRR